MNATLVMGKVHKLILVIDPHNRKGKHEVVEPTNAREMARKVREIELANKADWKPTEFPTDYAMYTEYQDVHGAIVRQGGYSMPLQGREPVKVGDKAYLSRCKGCGQTEWSEVPSDPEYKGYVTGEHTCENCN